MKYELFIANHLRFNKGTNHSAVSTLNVAITGIVLAIVIMVVSVSVVTGFKHTIVNKIGNLDSHIKIFNRHYDASGNISSSITFTDGYKEFLSTKADSRIKSVVLIGEIPCVIKSKEGFAGLRFKGVDSNYDLSYHSNAIVDGKASINGDSIIISSITANKLNAKVGDRLFLYFMNESNIRVRRATVSGIFSTDFDDYDAHLLLGNLAVLQSVNNWDKNTGSYIGINCHMMEDADATKESVVLNLSERVYSGNPEYSGEYSVSTIKENNPSHFSWLELLDTNIIVILGLMTFVACFAIISCLIIIILNRVSTIGTLKALGATNKSIRRIFIFILMKIIMKAMIIGNLIAFTLLLLQKHFHIITLNPETYFMSYVPIEFSSWLLLLNVGFIIVALLALLLPSMIVASISPSKAIRFE